MRQGLLLRAGTSLARAGSWEAATDDQAVASYTVYRDGEAVGTTEQTSFADTGLAGETEYAYRVAFTFPNGNLKELAEASGLAVSVAMKATLLRVARRSSG